MLFYDLFFMISLGLIPRILGSLPLNFFPRVSKPINSFFLTSFSVFIYIQEYYANEFSWWPIIVPFLLSLFIIYNVVYPQDTAKERQRVDCHTGFVMGCLLGVILSYFF